MPKNKEELNKVKSKRQAVLLLAGLKVFCEKGYDGATVDDVVKKANCSHGLFYHYYKSKKELFDAIIVTRADKANNFVDTCLKEDVSVIEKLRKVLNFFFNNFINDENFAYYYYFFLSRWFLLSNKLTVNPPTPEDTKPPRPQNPTLKIMENLFLEGQTNGEITDKYSAKDCAILLHTIVQGATLNYILLPKNIKSASSLPNTELIIDIFKSGDSVYDKKIIKMHTGI